MSNFTIVNASNIPLSEQQGTVPNLGTGLNDWFQVMTFTRVVKTVVAFQAVEVGTPIVFRGLIQPLSGRELAMKPEGQRKWNWISVYAQSVPNSAIMTLQPDEVVIYVTTQYRVMSTKNFANYGYIQYELVDDYTGSGP